MADDFLKARQVFGYHLLLKIAGHTRRDRRPQETPELRCYCRRNKAGKHVLFIAAITSKEPGSDQLGIAIPETEIRRAKLDVSIPLRVMVNELNADALETSCQLAERAARGAFSAAFTDKVVRGVHSVCQAGSLRLTRRTQNTLMQDLVRPLQL